MSKPHKSFLLTRIKNKIRSRIYYDGCILFESCGRYPFKEYGVNGEYGEYGGGNTPWVTETGYINI